MKERLVEDWLIRINERGYEVPFCQALASKGYRVLRCGHSPVEHGKDVLALAPDGTVCGFQLKSGDFAQADITKHHAQINMLVEARPVHPALSDDFTYRPFLVTTGEFKDPAISLIKELNAGWAHRALPTLEVINGRQLHVDFVSLSSDFWPVEAPAIRRFRELYLVDGRGDFDVPQFGKFIAEICKESKSGLGLERSAAATNLFTSYLLGDFYQQGDYWSVVQGWTVCAAQIAWAGESSGLNKTHWESSFELAKSGALSALRTLTDEVLTEGAFRVHEREPDEYTRVRNTTAIAAASCFGLIDQINTTTPAGIQPPHELILKFVERGRFLFWGEGAFSQFLMLFWSLEKSNLSDAANALLLNLIEAIAERNTPLSDNYFDDPYVSADEFLEKLVNRTDKAPPRRQAVESYCLLPFVVLAVRRNLRHGLENLWRKISHVRFTWFTSEVPADLLLWYCSKGKEHEGEFDQPQSWKDLQEFAARDDQARLPAILREDQKFALLFTLAFPHRILSSLTKHLDAALSKAR